MSKSTKAALLSGLLFPGIGHFWLKSYLRGSVLLALSVASLGVILNTATARAQVIAERIVSGEVAMEVAAISREISASSVAGGGAVVQLSVWLLAACWLAGIVDSWRIGRSKTAPDVHGEPPRSP